MGLSLHVVQQHHTTLKTNTLYRDRSGYFLMFRPWNSRVQPTTGLAAPRSVSPYLAHSRLHKRLFGVAGVQLGFHGGFIRFRVEEWLGEVGHLDQGGWVGVGIGRFRRGIPTGATQVAGVSACRLDIRICELLLLSMDSCVPPFTPLLASEGCRCFRSTAKYLFTVQLRHFLLISDCTLRDILHKVIINGPRWKEMSSLPLIFYNRLGIILAKMLQNSSECQLNSY